MVCLSGLNPAYGEGETILDDLHVDMFCFKHEKGRKLEIFVIVLFSVMLLLLQFFHEIIFCQNIVFRRAF